MTAIGSYAAGTRSEAAGQRGAPKGLFEVYDFDRWRPLDCNEDRTSGHFSRRFARSRVIIAWRNCCRNRPLLTAAYAILMIAGMCAAGAEERQIANTAGPIGFHIPAQPLANALQAYGQRTGVQVLYESNSAAGQTSGAVEGNFTPDAALNILLTGTDLRVRYLRPDAITLAPLSADGDGPPSAPFATVDLSLGTLRVRGSSDSDSAARLHDYSESVQADIQGALRKNAKTRAGDYRAVLDIWIDPSRTIQRTELFRSTGDHERDTAVTAALSGLTVSRPAPANTPQPVRVVVLVKSLQ
jgi:Secretin and TonB N terminus short domain/TonB C terminal